MAQASAEPSAEVKDFLERWERRKPKYLINHGNGRYFWAEDLASPPLVEEVQPAIEVGIMDVYTYATPARRGLRELLKLPEPELLRFGSCVTPGGVPQGGWKNLDQALLSRLFERGPIVAMGMRQSDGSVAPLDGLLYFDIDQSNFLDFFLATVQINASYTASQHRWTLEVAVKDPRPFGNPSVKENSVIPLADVSPVHYLSIIPPKTYHLDLKGIFRGGRGDHPPQVFENARVEFRVSYPGTLGGDPEMPMADVPFDAARIYSALQGVVSGDQAFSVVESMKHQGELPKPDTQPKYKRQHLFDGLERSGIHFERQKLYDLVIAIEQPKETSGGF